MTYHQPICKPIAKHVRHIAQSVERDEEEVILILSRSARVVSVVDEGELCERRRARQIQSVEDDDDSGIHKEEVASADSATLSSPKKVDADAVEHEKRAIRHAS